MIISLKFKKFSKSFAKSKSLGIKSLVTFLPVSYTHLDVYKRQNLYDVEKYILSEVETEMLTEGKNTNLLLVFENQQKREEFISTELLNISERIFLKFGESVMIFKTDLNPIKQNF